MPVCVKPHSCRSCHKRFADENRLAKHLNRTHGSEEFKTIQCNICQKRFINKSALGSHLRTHNGQGSLWECTICKETYVNREGLIGHVGSHSNNGSFPCPFCQKSRVFSGYMSIRKHIIKIHKSSGKQCTLCDRFFSSSQKYEEHMLRHSGQKRFPCAKCEKHFKRSDKLKEHVRRMHGCDSPVDEASKVLDEKTLQKQKCSEMRNERKLKDLNAQYLFKCEPCLIGFKRRGMLVNHIAKYHPNMTPDEVPELNLPIMKTTRDFYCHLCEKVYKSNAKRKAHIMKFHPGASKNEQPRNASFEQPAGTIAKKAERCPWCHKQYATNAKLLQHLRSKHADKAHHELRKRGKSRLEKAPENIEKDENMNLEISKSNECCSDGSSVDSFATEMFVGETMEDGLSSPESASLGEAESGMQLDDFTGDEDDDLTLAVCLMMSHANMPPEEVLVEMSHVEGIKTTAITNELRDVEAGIGERQSPTETPLTTEDVDVFMADLLVDLHPGPSFSSIAVPIVPKATDAESEEDCEIGGILADLPVMSLADDVTYNGTDYSLFDLNLSSAQLPPAEVVYSPYPPH